jgi:hypothetical protein
VILNSVSVSDSRAEGRDAGVVEVVVVGTVVEAVVVLGGVGELEVLEVLEELEEPEEPHAAITTAASAADSTAVIDLELRISCPSEDLWSRPRTGCGSGWSDASIRSHCD